MTPRDRAILRQVIRARIAAEGNGSIYDRQPVWLRWVTGIAIFLWFVPPLIAVFIRLIAG